MDKITHKEENTLTDDLKYALRTLADECDSHRDCSQECGLWIGSGCLLDIKPYDWGCDID